MADLLTTGTPFMVQCGDCNTMWDADSDYVHVCPGPKWASHLTVENLRQIIREEVRAAFAATADPFEVVRCKQCGCIDGHYANCPPDEVQP